MVKSISKHTILSDVSQSNRLSKVSQTTIDCQKYLKTHQIVKKISKLLTVKSISKHSRWSKLPQRNKLSEESQSTKNCQKYLKQ